jgi:hypothetical protein
MRVLNNNGHYDLDTKVTRAGAILLEPIVPSRDHWRIDYDTDPGGYAFLDVPHYSLRML